MKSILLVFFTLSVSLCLGQKKEIKKANKLFNSGDVSGAAAFLESNAVIFEQADVKVLNQKLYLEANISLASKDFQTAYEKFEAFKAAGGADSNYETQIQQLTADVVNSAITDNEQKRFEEAAEKLYLAYSINPNSNKDYLYYAASSSVNGGDYEGALKYYNMLRSIKYDGITTRYLAKLSETGEETEFSKTEFELIKKTKDYSDFREEKTDSKFPEIIKNIALIYAQLGNKDKAMEAVKEARKSDPKDLNLILTEANLYIELNESARFEELMKEAIAQDPNNSSLYFNLGVVSAQNGNVSDARSYYEKSIELNPEFESGYLNLVALILEGESKIVEEMNSLGNSRADNARYEILKISREDIYEECVPILERLIAVSKDEEAIKTLMNIYGTLGDNEGFKKMKALLE